MALVIFIEIEGSAPEEEFTVRILVQR